MTKVCVDGFLLPQQGKICFNTFKSVALINPILLSLFADCFPSRSFRHSFPCRIYPADFVTGAMTGRKRHMALVW